MVWVAVRAETNVVWNHPAGRRVKMNRYDLHGEHLGQESEWILKSIQLRRTLLAHNMHQEKCCLVTTDNPVTPCQERLQDGDDRIICWLQRSKKQWVWMSTKFWGFEDCSVWPRRGGYVSGRQSQETHSASTWHAGNQQKFVSFGRIPRSRQQGISPVFSHSTSVPRNRIRVQ